MGVIKFVWCVMILSTVLVTTLIDCLFLYFPILYHSLTTPSKKYIAIGALTTMSGAANSHDNQPQTTKRPPAANLTPNQNR